MDFWNEVQILKRKHILPTIASLTAGLSLLLLAGCCKSPHVVLLNAESGNVTSLQHHEYAVADVSSDADTAPDECIPQTTDETTQPTESPAVKEQENRPSNTTISLDRAIEIANADLARRGINATYRSNSGIDREKGQRVWELLFTTNGGHMPFIEYYINADDGNIVKFEWDD